jgi:hypothetical protein
MLCVEKNPKAHPVLLDVACCSKNSEEDERRYGMTKDKRKRRNKKASVEEIDYHQTTPTWLADRPSQAVIRLR